MYIYFSLFINLSVFYHIYSVLTFLRLVISAVGYEFVHERTILPLLVLSVLI